jgi:hypothetical protein
MAIGRITAVSDGVERFDFILGWHFWGTKEALIRARVARPEYFANGRRDKRGRRVRTVYARHDGRPVVCIEKGKEKYQITTYYVGAERARREARADAALSSIRFN